MQQSSLFWYLWLGPKPAEITLFRSILIPRTQNLLDLVPIGLRVYGLGFKAHSPETLIHPKLQRHGEETNRAIKIYESLNDKKGEAKSSYRG